MFSNSFSHGWLVIDKPLHVTSAHVVKLVRRKFGNIKVGHAGTLDPLATGILPLALGEATKTMPYIVMTEKKYRFMVQWGESRTTDDQEGEILESSSDRPLQSDIEDLMPRFLGLQQQQPPNYSALKIQGRRACDLMRAQQTVLLQPRQINIYAFSLIEMVSRSQTLFEVVCGPGTYVRSLARDLGNLLGCYGYAASIDRVSVGKFEKKQALSLEMLASSDENVILRTYKKEILDVLDDIPAISLTEFQVSRLKQGQGISLDSLNLPYSSLGVFLALGPSQHPIAIARIIDDKFWPLRVFNI